MAQERIRDLRKQATREQILDAATELLSRDGYAALRVAAVAQQAKVSLGGQLHHFASKESLVLAVLDRVWNHVMDEARLNADAKRGQSDESKADLLRRVSDSAHRFYGSPEFLIYLDIFLSVRRGTPIGEAAAMMLVAQRTATEDLWLPQLARHGFSPENSRTIIRAIWATARGLAISSHPRDEDAAGRKVLDMVTDALSLHDANALEGAAR